MDRGGDSRFWSHLAALEIYAETMTLEIHSDHQIMCLLIPSELSVVILDCQQIFMVAELGYNPQTSGLWDKHASTVIEHEK